MEGRIVVLHYLVVPGGNYPAVLHNDRAERAAVVLAHAAGFGLLYGELHVCPVFLPPKHFFRMGVVHLPCCKPEAFRGVFHPRAGELFCGEERFPPCAKVLDKPRVLYPVEHEFCAKANMVARIRAHAVEDFPSFARYGSHVITLFASFRKHCAFIPFGRSAPFPASF
ncbi:Uncharacterised protein [uncultured archaeon]|nr:Uncharacterised protein [uncultured archaeon]